MDVKDTTEQSGEFREHIDECSHDQEAHDECDNTFKIVGWWNENGIYAFPSNCQELKNGIAAGIMIDMSMFNNWMEGSSLYNLCFPIDFLSKVSKFLSLS